MTPEQASKVIRRDISEETIEALRVFFAPPPFTQAHPHAEYVWRESRVSLISELDNLRGTPTE